VTKPVPHRPYRACTYLTFHGVGNPPRLLDPGEDAVWVEEDMFLHALDTAAGRLDVQIAFDDGNTSDVAVALPHLLERGLSATFFVVAGRIDQPGFLSSGDIMELAAAGMQIGTHGMRHRPWRHLTAAELDEEVIAARRSIEQVVGTPVTHAAVPFGAYDRHVLGALRRAGYDRVFTSDGGRARRESWLQQRTSLRKQDGPDDLARILSAHTRLKEVAIRQAKVAVKRWR
jgi:peptidoglycan/xylan/chitin deacetylase (PgdA/CDA1 family)